MKKRGQVWVETVIYTLIGLSLIGLVLAIVTPKINDFKDRSVIEQTIDSLETFDSRIDDVLAAPGNVRVVKFRMKKGSLFFDTVNDSIRYVMDDSRVIYSEPGVTIELGGINVTTTEGTKRHNVELLLSYGNNLTFDGSESLDEVKFSATSIPYRFSIENKGFQGIGYYNIDISEVS